MKHLSCFTIQCNKTYINVSFYYRFYRPQKDSRVEANQPGIEKGRISTSQPTVVWPTYKPDFDDNKIIGAVGGRGRRHRRMENRRGSTWVIFVWLQEKIIKFKLTLLNSKRSKESDTTIGCPSLCPEGLWRSEAAVRKRRPNGGPNKIPSTAQKWSSCAEEPDKLSVTQEVLCGEKRVSAVIDTRE